MTDDEIGEKVSFVGKVEDLYLMIILRKF